MVASHDRLRRLHTATYRLEVRGPKWKLQMILADQVWCEVTPVICVPWLIRVTCMQRQNANMWSLQTWGFFLCRNISCGLWHYWLFRMIPVVCVWLVCFVLVISLLRLLGASLQVLSGGLGRLLVVMRESQFGRMAESCAPKTTWDWPINAECHSQVAKQNNGNRLAAWDSNKEGGATDSKAETTPWLCLKKRCGSTLKKWLEDWDFHWSGFDIRRSARIETNKQWLVCFLDKWCPELPTSSPWQHSNAFHHIQSLFLSPSLTIVIHCVPVMVHSSRKFPLRSDCADSVPRALRALQVGRAVQKNCAEAWSCLVFVMYMHWCMILHPGCFKTEGECSLRWCNWKKDIRLCQVCLHFAVVSSSTIMHHSCIIVCCCL